MTKQVEQIILSVALVASLLAPKAALAYYEPSQEVNQIVVDKQIKGLDQAVWQDNYPSSFMVFGPNTQFEFKITVKNTGNRNLTWIKVTDAMPKVLTFVYGREGTTLNSDNNTFSWSIPEIKPGEEQSTIIRVKTKSAEFIPVKLTEKVNKVCVRAESGANDCDEAHFWVGNGAQKQEASLPTTGASPLAAISLGSTLATGLFFALKKFIEA